MNLDQERTLWDIFPVDGNGRPTTFLSYRILKLLFSTYRDSYTPTELANLLASDTLEVDVICRQLHMADLVTENLGENKSYKYNLNSSNIDVQAGFEKFIVDVEEEGFPTTLMSEYSPSIRT